MSNRAHFYRLVQDAAGNVLPGLQVTVYQVGTSDLLTDTLFVDDSSTDTLTNPFTVDASGAISFYLDHPKRVRLQVQATGQVPQTYDDVDVVPPATFNDVVALRASDGTTFWNFGVQPDGTLTLTSPDGSTTHTFTPTT